MAERLRQISGNQTKSNPSPGKAIQENDLGFSWILGGREGHTANYVQNGANRAARGRAGVA